MNLSQRKQLFEQLRSANPSPKTELEFTTPFELLVAVMLSAQATDRGVNRATAQLFPVANTPETVLALGYEGLEPYLKRLNYYRSKTRHVLATSAILIEQFGGAIPEQREALERLPGVGRKTANVILNTVFRQPAIAVDTHIFRVANRTGLAPGKTVRQVEEALLRAVPDEFLLDAHHWLVLHGRYICQARRPKCGECVVDEVCEYTAKEGFSSRPSS